ncbi:MAG: hypothetical protein AB7F09_21900 [Parvibaculaceae bacterium]
MPKSAAMLLSGLATETEWNVRFGLQLNAISECRLANNTAAAVKVAQALQQDFRDVASLVALSYALIENDELEAGLLRAKEALELAIQGQTLVNYAAGNLVRLTVKTGSVEAVNEAMEALVDSTDVPREGDCVLDIDWCDDAEALGADMELISWIRAVAETQMPHVKRKRMLASRSRAKQKFKEKYHSG